MAIYTVTNTNDSDTGSLREAITKANETFGADIINFEPTVFDTPRTITLTSGELNIQDDLTIQGTGANNLRVSGNNAFRVFEVNDGSNVNKIAVVIDGLTKNGVRSVSCVLSEYFLHTQLGKKRDLGATRENKEIFVPLLAKADETRSSVELRIGFIYGVKSHDRLRTPHFFV